MQIITSEGAPLEVACTPAGPELCFNAKDDNCNGVIDEGCGVATGLLQFSIAWGDSPADVDIIVTDPAGAKVSEGTRTSPSGLRLDHDCPGDACGDQNIENIFLEGEDPVRGKYAVEVKLVELRGAPLPITVRLGVRVGSRSYGAELSLSPIADKKTFTFEL